MTCPFRTLLRTTLAAIVLTGLAPPGHPADPPPPLLPPEILGEAQTLEISGSFGHPVIVLELAGGAPDTLTWIRNGEPVRPGWYGVNPSGNRLSFDRVWEEAEGTYQLIAENAAGRTFSHPILVKVDDGLPIRITPAGGTFTNNVAVTLEVVHEGPPPFPDKLFYTLNGSSPHEGNGAQYSGPFVIAGDSILVVRQFAPLSPAGIPHSATFRIETPPLPNPGPDAALMAHFRFDEASGTLAADEAQWQPARLSGTGAQFVSGAVSGNGLDLDRNQEGYATLTSPIADWAGDWTVALWIRTEPGDTATSAVVGMGGVNVRGGFHIGLNLYGSTLAAYAGDGRILGTQAPVNDGAWHHVALVHTAGGDVRLHVDGGRARTRAINTPIVSNGTPLLLGRFGAGFQPSPFHGMLDDLQIYNAALPEELVSQLTRQPGQALPLPRRPPPTPPVLINDQPWVEVGTGLTPTLSYRFEGSPPFSFQWYHNGVPLPGAVEPTLMLPPVDDALAGTYFLAASNSGGTVRGRRFTVNHSSRLAASLNPGSPSDQVIDVGTPLHLALSPRATLTRVQWFHEDVLISGGNGVTHDFPAVTAAHSGDYYAKVESARGTHYSSVGRIEVLVPRAPIFSGPSFTVAKLEGETAQLSAAFTGSQPISFQWLREGVPVPGATNATLTFMSLQFSDAGRYVAQASNSAGSATSPPFTVQVEAAPRLVFSPSSASVPATLTLSYTPADRFFFIRYTLDGSDPVSGSLRYTTPLVISSPTTVRAALFSGNARVGGISEQRFDPPQGLPSIVDQPADLNVARGDQVTLRVGVQGHAPFSFQWYLDGRLAGTTSQPTFQTTITANASFSYYVVVLNSVGSTASRMARMTLVPNPTTPLVLRPLPAFLPYFQGESVALTLNYTYSSSTILPLTFAWYKNGIEIPSARQATLHLESLKLADTGRYSVLVRYRGGEIWSNECHLQVDSGVGASPTLESQPSDRTHAQGPGMNGVFLVSARGGHPLTYTWVHDGVPLEGHNSASLDLPDLRASRAGHYYVVVSNPYGSVKSRVATLELSYTFESANWGVVADPWDGTFPARVALASIVPNRFHEIRYTLNGRAPTEQSTPYRDPILLNHPARLLAALFRDGIQISPVSIMDYVGPSADRPVIVRTSGDRVSPFNQNVDMEVQVAGSPPFEFEWFRDGVKLEPPPDSRWDSTYLTRIRSQVGSTGVQSYHVIARNAVGAVQSRQIQILRSDMANAFGIPPRIIAQPQAIAAAIGSKATLSIEAMGRGLHYEWRIPGRGMITTTVPWLTLDPLQGTENGTFQVTVVNFAGRTNSESIELRLFDLASDGRPQITRHPQNVRGVVGSPLTVFVNAIGASSLRYHWQMGTASPIVTTQAWLTLPALTPDHAGFYRVTVENAVGVAVSNSALLTLVDPPAGTAPPALAVRLTDMTSDEGASTVFFADGPNSEGLRFHWFLGQTAPVTTTRPYVTQHDIRLEQGGLWRVLVESPYGTELSSPARHVVRPKARQPGPQITRSPTGSSVAFGADIHLSVEAEGTLPLNYQWLLNDSPIHTPNLPSITLPFATLARAGTYQVIVSHRDGSAVSREARVVVAPPNPPSLREQPADFSVDEGQTARFALELEGEAPFTFLWYFEGRKVHESDFPEWIVPEISATRSGVYEVQVSNSSGTVRTRPFRVTVRSRLPALLLQPVDAFLIEGGSHVLMVSVEGSWPMDFQWRFEGRPIPGATEASLPLPAITPAQAGGYDVVITNASGAITSRLARIEVSRLIGGTVQFVNRITGTFDAPVFGLDGVTRLEGAAYVAQLSAGPTPEALTPIGPPAPFRNGAGAGYWDPLETPIRRIPSVDPGNLAWVQVRAWAVADGATFHQAKEGGHPVGESKVFSVITGGIGTPPTLPSLLLRLESFQLRLMPPPQITSEPEPTSVAVGAPLALSVTALGGNLAYQWFHDSNAIPGATASVLRVPVTSREHAGRYRVRVSNPGGAVLSREVLIAVDQHRILRLEPVAAVFEGGSSRVPLTLWRRPDSPAFSRLEVRIRFQPEHLTWLDAEGAPSPDALRHAQAIEPGLVQLELEVPSGFATGTNRLADLLFRARDVDGTTSSPVTLEDVRFLAPDGSQLLGGSHHAGATIEIRPQIQAADNNNNGLLDLGDSVIIQTLLTRTVPIPKWVIANNDYDLNGRLDRADLLGSLKALVVHDLANLRPADVSARSDGSHLQRLDVTPHAGLLEITTHTPAGRPAPGSLLTVRIFVRANATPLRAASFTVRFPAAAMTPLEARLLAPAALWSEEGASAWMTKLPGTVDGPGRVRFAATTTRDWQTSGGDLVEWDFRILPGALAQAQWEFELEDIFWTLDGYQVHDSVGSSATVHIRPRAPSRLTGARLTSADPTRFLIEGLAEPGGGYRVQFSEGLETWIDDGAVTAGDDGQFQVIRPLSRQPGVRLYRIVEIP